MLLLLGVASAAAQTEPYHDAFTTGTYDGSDGTIDWSPSPWAEEQESDGVALGNVRVVSGAFCASGDCLRLEGDNPTKDYAAVRTADLDGATSATLTYQYRRQNYWSCRTRVQVRSSGAASWTTLATYSNNGGDPSQQSASHDITSYIASTTQIRFISDAYCDAGEYFHADDIAIDDGGSLPVELVSFDAVVDGADVLLAWETASETNNAGFAIEMKGAAQVDFETIDFVDGHGTTSLPQRYAHRIEALDPGRYVFRLQQIDYDGQFEYLPEAEVAIAFVEPFMLEPAYPNPFRSIAHVRFGVSTAQPVEVALYDLRGRRVRTLYRGVPPSGQMTMVQIEGSGLAQGLYVVHLVSKQGRAAQAVIVR